LCCLQRDSGKKRDERKLGSNGALARSQKTHTPQQQLWAFCVCTKVLFGFPNEESKSEKLRPPLPSPT